MTPDAPRPTSQLAADVAIPGTVQFLTEYADRLEGVKGYPVHAQEIRKLLAHADALVARITDLEARNATRGQALAAICQGNDRGYWIDIYREAGGGYEGLQAIASHALAATREGE